MFRRLPSYEFLNMTGFMISRHSEARLQRPATKNLLKVLSRKLQIYALAPS